MDKFRDHLPKTSWRIKVYNLDDKKCKCVGCGSILFNRVEIDGDNIYLICTECECEDLVSYEFRWTRVK